VDTEGWIKVLEERIEGLKLQVGRLISHVESEQRHTVRHGKDIDQLIKQNEKRENDWRFWVSIGVAVIAALIAWFK
jgi:hypothetical protein